MPRATPSVHSSHGSAGTARGSGRPPRLRAALAALSLVISSLVAVAVGVAAPASAEEYVAVPADGIFKITGHGNGHGLGMAQYGALGAARQGLTYAQILDFYYPGATRGDFGNPTVRVQLTGFNGSSVQVGPDAGGTLTVTDAGNTANTATETDGRFRVVINGGDLRVQRGDNSGANWQDYPLGTPTTAGQVLFSAPNGVWVYAADGSARKYYGTIRVLGSSSAAVQAVNDVDMQHYLYASVPYEVSASWPVEAVKAQSVAARSYALSVKGSNANWDLCDTDACQMYVGTQWKTAAGVVTNKEYPASNAAIDATAGITVLESGGGAAFTQYASSNGGWSTSGSKPYLAAKADPYSTATDDPHRDWTFQLSATWLKATYPEVGDIVGLRVVSRDGYGDWGGRVTAAEVVGTAGTKRVTNPRFGMKSNYWTAGGGADPTPIILRSGRSIGSLDGVSAAPGSITVSGWSFNEAAMDRVGYVDIYVDGKMATRLVANTTRNDVGGIYPKAGAQHGYTATLALSGGGAHTVCAYGIDGVKNPSLGCKSVTLPSGSPLGNLEGASGLGGNVRVNGWTLDPDSVSSISVHVYVDGKWTAAQTASGTRPDVGRVYAGYGDAHGFDLTLAVAAGKHEFCVYGINVGVGANKLIGCRTVTTSQNPIGGVTLAGYSGGMAHVTGWALDPDTTDPLRVHVYANGGFVMAGDANTDRPDVAAKYPSYGAAHGFDLDVKMSPGSNNLCVYGINVGPGTTNPSLGCVQLPGDGSPLGSLDNAVAGKAAVTVSGWAIDLKTTGAIQVAITVDGKTMATVAASSGRPDVGAAYPAFGANHGYTAVVSAAAGTRQICAIAINSAAGGPKTTLGCRAVKI